MAQSPEEQIPVSPTPASPIPAKPKFSQRVHRVLYALFSPETRTGRITRPVLRWLAAITGLFALGLMVGYLALYQPVSQQKDTALLQLTMAQEQVRTGEANLKTMTADRDAVQKKLTQSEADLSKARAENDLLLVLVSVNNARVALVNKDGASAKTALDQAQLDLPRALPVLEKYDKAVADVLKSRLELASKELVIDPQAAQTDLGKLQSDLLALLATVFKK